MGEKEEEQDNFINATGFVNTGRRELVVMSPPLPLIYIPRKRRRTTTTKTIIIRKTWTKKHQQQQKKNYNNNNINKNNEYINGGSGNTSSIRSTKYTETALVVTLIWIGRNEYNKEQIMIVIHHQPRPPPPPPVNQLMILMGIFRIKSMFIIIEK